MSWTTYKTSITAVLGALGYREIPENKTVENTSLAFNDKAYQLQYRGVGDIVLMGSDKLQYDNLVHFEVRYKNMDSAERHANADAFQTLFDAISNISGFLGFNSNPQFIDIDEKHTKGSFDFTIGAECN
jgi:hypothetical protein